MNPYYPLFLDLSDRKILVVGGGSVALRKVRSLIQFHPQIWVVAPKLSPELKKLEKGGRVQIVPREFQSRDLIQKELVFAATDDVQCNVRVSQECLRRGIWVNVADTPSLCSFIVPSIVRRGDVTFAISTGGSSPALAKFLRKKIESIYGSEVRIAARTLKKYRDRLLVKPLRKRRVLLNQILNDSVFSKLKRGEKQVLELRLKGLL